MILYSCANIEHNQKPKQKNECSNKYTQDGQFVGRSWGSILVEIVVWHQVQGLYNYSYRVGFFIIAQRILIHARYSRVVSQETDEYQFNKAVILEIPSIYSKDQAYQLVVPKSVYKQLKLITKKLPLKPLKSPQRGKMRVPGAEPLVLYGETWQCQRQNR